MEIVSADSEEQCLLQLPAELGKMVRSTLKAGRAPPEVRIISKSRKPGAPLPRGADPRDPPPAFDVVVYDRESGTTHTVDAEFVKLPTVVETYKSSDEKNYFKSGSLAGVIRATGVHASSDGAHKPFSAGSAPQEQPVDPDSSDDESGVPAPRGEQTVVHVEPLTRSGRRTNVLPSGITPAADRIVMKHFRRHRRALLQGASVPEVSAAERHLVAMAATESTSLSLVTEHESLVHNEQWMADLPDEYELEYENGKLVQATALPPQAAARILEAATTAAKDEGVQGHEKVVVDKGDAASLTQPPEQPAQTATSAAPIDATQPSATPAAAAPTSQPPSLPAVSQPGAAPKAPAPSPLPAPSPAVPASASASSASSSSSSSATAASAAAAAAGGGTTTAAGGTVRAETASEPLSSSSADDAEVAALKKKLQAALSQAQRLRAQARAQRNPMQRRRLNEAFSKAQAAAREHNSKLKALKAKQQQ